MLETSLAGARMPLSMCLISLLKENICSLASPSSCTDLCPLFWPLLATNAKTDQPTFKVPSLMKSFVIVY